MLRERDDVWTLRAAATLVVKRHLRCRRRIIESMVVGRELTIEAAREMAATLGQLTGAAMSETGGET
jgi:hypothetical protein